MKDNSYLSNMSLSADASKELIESMGLPKSVIDATKLQLLLVMTIKILNH